MHLLERVVCKVFKAKDVEQANETIARIFAASSSRCARSRCASTGNARAIAIKSAGVHRRDQPLEETRIHLLCDGITRVARLLRRVWQLVDCASS